MIQWVKRLLHRHQETEKVGDGWGMYQKGHRERFSCHGTVYRCFCGKAFLYPDNREFPRIEVEA